MKGENHSLNVKILTVMKHNILLDPSQNFLLPIKAHYSAPEHHSP